MINIDLIKKIIHFLNNSSSLNYLDVGIFETIDKYKENNNIDFNDYYLEYIKQLPKLDIKNAIKISREVYQLYGKEKEFDKILDHLINNHNIDTGSLNKNDENCIIRSSESRLLLSGTYYDVVLLCHEIGHKLKYDNSLKYDSIMNSLLSEAPPITFELAANDYLKDKYDVDINAYELRKNHILSKTRDTNIENKVFLIIINMIKKRKLNVINLYNELIKDKDIIKYFNDYNVSIEECVDEGLSNYAYDIGFILGNYMNNSNNKIKILDILLEYKNNGITSPFTIDDSIIKETLGIKNSRKY